MSNKFIINTTVALIFGIVLSKIWETSPNTVVFILGSLFGQLWLQIMQNKRMTVSLQSYKLSKFAKDMEKYQKNK